MPVNTLVTSPLARMRPTLPNTEPGSAAVTTALLLARERLLKGADLALVETYAVCDALRPERAWADCARAAIWLGAHAYCLGGVGREGHEVGSGGGRASRRISPRALSPSRAVPRTPRGRGRRRRKGSDQQAGGGGGGDDADADGITRTRQHRTRRYGRPRGPGAREARGSAGGAPKARLAGPGGRAGAPSGPFIHTAAPPRPGPGPPGCGVPHPAAPRPGRARATVRQRDPPRLIRRVGTRVVETCYRATVRGGGPSFRVQGIGDLLAEPRQGVGGLLRVV
eukprot:scaffold3586_cov404-Prasinococcus_capsulatus_cf.AAC.17